MAVAGIFKHVNCRNSVYPKSNILRFAVPDDVVFWTVPYTKYSPPEYTAPHIKGQKWADSDIDSSDFQPKWNQEDGVINRVSAVGPYEINNGIPCNPIGRTGIRGRGLLGRWGPNHAADPVVTRWKRDNGGKKIADPTSQKNILQVVIIQRGDNKMWALPGGMVDPGEKVSATLKREFMEEALRSNNKEGQQMVDEFFKCGGIEIYRGYVDDYRNTDNAWIETVASNFHDEDGKKIGNMELTAGDDAIHAKWVDVENTLVLHANHIFIVGEVAKRLNAHW